MRKNKEKLIKPKLAIKNGKDVYTGRSYESIIMSNRSVRFRGSIRGMVDEHGVFHSNSEK